MNKPKVTFVGLCYETIVLLPEPLAHPDVTLGAEREANKKIAQAMREFFDRELMRLLLPAEYVAPQPRLLEQSDTEDRDADG